MHINASAARWRAADAKLKCLGASFQLFEIPHTRTLEIRARRTEAGKVRRVDSSAGGREVANGVTAMAAVEDEDEDRGARDAACRPASTREG